MHIIRMICISLYFLCIQHWTVSKAYLCVTSLTYTEIPNPIVWLILRYMPQELSPLGLSVFNNFVLSRSLSRWYLPCSKEAHWHLQFQPCLIFYLLQKINSQLNWAYWYFNLLGSVENIHKYCIFQWHQVVVNVNGCRRFLLNLVMTRKLEK